MTKLDGLYVLQGITEPPASGVNVDIEAKQLIDELCIDHLNEIPTKIWARLINAMNEKYPNGWFGISNGSYTMSLHH